MSFKVQYNFKRVCISLTAATVLVFANAAYAADTPVSLKGATTVDAAKARSLIDSGVMVIDSRVANEYAESHIKGAVNVPYKEKSAKAVNFDASQDSFDLSKLPANKSTPIVIYCNGPECWKSYKASTEAIKAGHKSVYWFRLGMPEWKDKSYPTE